MDSPNSVLIVWNLQKVECSNFENVQMWGELHTTLNGINLVELKSAANEMDFSTFGKKCIS